MPPVVALILCTIFVLWLLRLERKQAPDLSHTLWIPTIWMLVISSKGLGVLFGSGGASIEEGSPLDATFLIALFCIALLILTKRRFNWSNAIKENIWLMLILGYMLVSVIWSDIFFISFKRWTRELVAIVMAFIIAIEPSPREAIQSVFRRTIYTLMPFSLMLIKYYPHLGVIYGRWSGNQTWVGIAAQKNGLGQMCLISAIFLIWSLMRRWQSESKPTNIKYQTFIEVFMLILTLYLMGGPQNSLSYSATANIAFVIGLVAMIGFLIIKKWHIIPGQVILMSLITFIIVYGIVTPFLGGLSIIDPSAAMGREENLTGRNVIWERLIPYAMERPILGHGFGGFWTTEIRDLTSSHAHNGYLGVLLELGFLGLLFIALFLIHSIRKAQQLLKSDFHWGILWICFLLVTVAYNITESSINNLSNHLTVILVFLAIAYENNKIPIKEHSIVNNSNLEQLKTNS